MQAHLRQCQNLSRRSKIFLLSNMRKSAGSFWMLSGETKRPFYTMASNALTNFFPIRAVLTLGVSLPKVRTLQTTPSGSLPLTVRQRQQWVMMPFVTTSVERLTVPAAHETLAALPTIKLLTELLPRTTWLDAVGVALEPTAVTLEKPSFAL